MEATDKIFKIIRLAEHAQRDLTDWKENGVTYTILKKLCDISKDVTNILIEFSFDTLVLQLQCEVSDKRVIEQSLEKLKIGCTQLIEQIKSLGNEKERAFNYITIYKLCEEECINHPSYLQLEQIKSECQKSIKDEQTWHMLARAYYSRGKYRSGKALSKEDMDYIQAPLKEYQKHFNVGNIDLDQMYDDYYDVMLKRCRDLRQRESEYTCIVNREVSKMSDELSKDVFDELELNINSILCELDPTKPDVISNINSIQVSKKKIGRPKATRYESIPELCNFDMTKSDALLKYLEQQDSFNTAHVKALKDVLDKYHIINTTSYDVFTVLLLKSYPEKLTFNGVDSVRSANPNFDLIKQVDNFFKNA